jgi:hypothetical protein
MASRNDAEVSGAASWLAGFNRALNTVRAFLPSIEPSWLPEHRKSFIATVLERRFQWLEQQMGSAGPSGSG